MVRYWLIVLVHYVVMETVILPEWTCKKEGKRNYNVCVCVCGGICSTLVDDEIRGPLN